MLRSIQEITGYKIQSLDGNVGKAADFYFDDVGWFVRYVVTDTGGWLTGRKVLVSPEAFGEPQWRDGLIPVHLSRRTIEESPPIDEHAPVHRENEGRLRAFYGWPNWWSTPMHGLLVPSAREVVEAQTREAPVATEERDPSLRSSGEVRGYHIAARDGEIGHVSDFIVDDATWAIRYLVVDTRNVLPGKKVLLSPHWISEVRWTDEKVAVDQTTEQIREAPEFDPSEPINREQETRLYDFYGRPKYWE